MHIESSKITHGIRQIEGYSFHAIKQKILAENAIPAAEVDEAIQEFRKFLMLILYYPDQPMAMTSKEIDTVWHTFILFTQRYADFCTQAFGRYIHHEPVSSEQEMKPEYQANLFDSYRAHFGDMPKIWNKTNAICYGPHCGTPSHCAYDCHGESDVIH